MLNRVAETTYRYSMFSPGQRVGVAVSGGADSVALLHILKELSPRWNLSLRVLHLNHKLRGAESDGDADFVRDTAHRLGLELTAEEMDVAARLAESGGNLEQISRDARYGFFRRLLQSGELERVALGHTRTDQAETVLYRLLRGSGTAGLAGIRPVTREGFVRPLINVDRPEVIAWLRLRGLPWREDSSNFDLRLERNRIRHVLLPQLARDWNPRIERVLARTAAIAADEELYWDVEAGRLVRALTEPVEGGLLLDAAKVGDLPPAVVRRLLRRAVEQVKGDLRGIDALHVERLSGLLGGGPGEGRVEIPGATAERSFEWVRLVRAGATAAPVSFEALVRAPGELALPGGKSVIRLELEEQAGRGAGGETGYNTEGDALDGTAGTVAFELRSWRPGDRFHCRGAPRPAKVSELFERARIPSWERSGWPMLLDGTDIIWTRRFGVAQGRAPGDGCRRIVRVREIHGGSAVESKACLPASE